jgi:hypothetical protein
MWLCFRRLQKPHERFSIPNDRFYRTDCFSGRKGGTGLAVRKRVPYPCRPTSPCSVEATEVCMPFGNIEFLHAALYKSTRRAWSDADIIEPLGLEVSPFWHVI